MTYNGLMSRNLFSDYHLAPHNNGFCREHDSEPLAIVHVEQSAIHCDCSHLTGVLQKSPENLLVP